MSKNILTNPLFFKKKKKKTPYLFLRTSSHWIFEIPFGSESFFQGENLTLFPKFHGNLRYLVITNLNRKVGWTNGSNAEPFRSHPIDRNLFLSPNIIYAVNSELF